MFDKYKYITDNNVNMNLINIIIKSFFFIYECMFLVLAF